MKILLCNTVFLINNLHPFIEKYCKDYLYEGDRSTDFEITVSVSDIEYERVKSRREDIKEGIPVRKFTDEYLETIAAYRKVCLCLLDKGIILFHGSVVSVDGTGYLFTAKSGTGKSTHTKLWREYFKDRAVMINDDKPLLEIKDGKVIVYGTPWDGKHRLSTNTCVPLKAICLLHRGSTDTITEITSKEAYPMLLQQVNRPLNNVSAMKKTLQLVDQLCTCMKFYDLYCTMDIEAAEVAYEGMNER